MRPIPGYSKACAKCFEVKLDDDFDFQVTNPNKRYAWCRDCMETSPMKPIPERRHKDYKKEVVECRNKAKQLKKLSTGQIEQLRADRKSGMKVKDICVKYGVGNSTVYKYINGDHRV